MSRFHTLEVSAVHHETPESIVIDFAVPEASRSDFAFQHGQYLTLRLTVDGEELRRSYSICSCPLDAGGLSIAVKKVPHGRASTQLVDKLKPGMRIEAMPPMGGFTTPLDPSKARHFVLFAAGSGITPIMSILETVLRTEPRSRVTLFYGNRSEDAIIFKRKLGEMAAAHPDRLHVHHIISQGRGADALHQGRITGERASALMDAFASDELGKEYFVCGPEQMIAAVREVLEGRGVDRRSIHFELFTTPVAAPVEKKAAAAGEASFTGVADVKVILDGREHELKVPARGDAVLDAALDAGLDVPFACKGAVCCTCKARVLEGRVEMEMNYALTDDEVADGYVLTCQTHPRSQRVVIDYDQH
ncbi:MAG: 2Fe-2S iron-sulfur cluster-binding protein [Flavobacteriales bacterium]|nr:MAG: 2Fe-2S iron-sulfur cluster-binding protein [Flavobacteriales bacterium]